MNDKTSITTETTNIVFDHSTKRSVRARLGRPFRQHHWLGWSVAGALLILGIGGISYHVWSVRSATATATAVAATKAKAEAALPGASLMDKINNALSSGQYDQALQLLQVQTPQNSSQILHYKALVYYNKGDYQTALNLYGELAQTTDFTASDAAIAGSSAQNLKQYGQALQYYEKAKSLTLQDTTNNTRDADAAVYQAEIDQVKKLQ